jgi:hypothetical protein
MDIIEPLVTPAMMTAGLALVGLGLRILRRS